MTNPAMRFRRDDGITFPDWDASEIGNVADIYSGGTPSTSVSEYWDGSIQWLTPTEINSKYVHNSRRTITSAGLENSSAKLLPIGALLLTTRATIGACSINNFDGAVSTNQGFQSLICKSALFNEYAYYAITRDKFQKELIKYSSGSTFLEISSKNLKKLPIPIPCLEEQQKIASFFSTLDQKIDLNERKLETLEKLKKGLMQKIFNRKIRFKKDDGTDFPGWTLSSLQNIVDINPRSDNLPDVFIYVDLESVSKGELVRQNWIKKEQAPSRAQRLVQDGDILFQTVRPYQMNNFLFRTYYKEQYVASTGYAQLRTKDADINFVYHLIHSSSFLNQVFSRCTGGAYPAINPTQLGTIKIWIPCLKEQQKIGQFLSSIETKITLQKKYVRCLTILKIGLLQKMFI